MATVNNKKTLRVEDFGEDQKELVERLAFTINPFMDEVISAFNGRIDLSNLTFEFKTFSLVVESGVPKTPTKFSVDGRVLGIIVIKVNNLTNNNNLTAAPFLTYSESGNLVTVKHITGLADSTNYRVTALVIK